MWTVWITVFGLMFGFITTTLGAATVYAIKGEISAKTNALLLGIASGVMLAASVWSLLLPAIEQMSEKVGALACVPIGLGIVLGGVLLVLLDKSIPKNLDKNEWLKTFSSKETRGYFRMFLAVTLHNIPEGLAVGFAFGIAAARGDMATYFSALGLAIGIGIQNFPEGAAISLPMKSVCGKNKSFFWGSFSGFVEPIFSVIGYFLSTSLSFLQPWLLSFAAGAMIFVSAQDLIPRTNTEKMPYVGAWGVLIGFVMMMALDVVLG